MTSQPGDLGHIQSVNYNKPQLLHHQQSQHSITASDDYYSFSSDQRSNPSDRSPQSQRITSNGSKVTVVRYATPQSHPPSQPTSANQSQVRLIPPEGTSDIMSRPSPQPAQAQAVQLDTVPPETANAVRFGGNQVKQISPRAHDSPASQNPLQQPNTPTPGVDDTPYIRFAIEQLTRDEEVAGAGRQESVVSEEDLGERLIGDEGLGYFHRVPLEPNPQREDQQQQRQSLLEQTEQPRTSSRLNRSDMLIAVEPEESDYRYPVLDYVPLVLRPWALGLAVFACLWAIAGIAFSNGWSQRHQGLLDYTGTSGARYFVFQFLPQLLAGILVFWTFIIQAAVYRITPFSIMASERQVSGVLQNLSILPRNFLLPEFSHFRHGEPLIGIALFSFWLANLFAVPLLSCLFQTKYYEIAGQGTWRWTAVQGVGWTAIALYTLLTLSLSMLLFRFCRSWTGLMWDPVSLADLIPMIQRSNIVRDFHETETATSVDNSFLQPRILRLGYWREIERPEIFYGIGEEYSPAGRPTSFSSADTREKRPTTASSAPVDRERQSMLQNDEAFERGLHSPFTRYRFTVWFLRDVAILTWIGIVFALLTAFVVVSFVKGAIPHGFKPLLPTLASIKGFSSSNFLYSFLPALIGNVLFLAWQPIDIYLRALQPFAGLASADGTSAAESLLLSYPTQSHLEALILSLGCRHWKVACTSFIGFISIAIPILAGGVFMALYYPDQSEIRIAACLPAYYALIAFCAVYALSFLTIWPRRCRYLPHAVYTLADLISFLYQSPLLGDKVLREPRSKPDLVTRLVVTIPGQRDGSRFGFGVFRGLDGNEHLGIDRVFRPGQAEMLIMGW